VQGKDITSSTKSLLADKQNRHDPTAASFTWAIWFLSIHPSWQAQLRDEIKTNIQYRFFTHDFADFDAASVLENLPILNAVCNETLRLMPTTPVTTRIAREDTTILGHPVRGGTKLFIIPWAINRSTDSFGPEAETFDPSRWIDSNGKANNIGGASSNYAFSTFLHGPRKCIGQGYAKAEIRTFVAVLVGRFKFEMANKEEVPFPAGMFAIKPRGGLKVKLRLVGGW
jgi:cytochrome P450